MLRNNWEEYDVEVYDAYFAKGIQHTILWSHRNLYLISPAVQRLKQKQCIFISPKGFLSFGLTKFTSIGTGCLAHFLAFRKV